MIHFMDDSYFLNRRKMSLSYFHQLWIRLVSNINEESSKIPYPQLRVGTLSYSKRIPITETDLIVLSVMRLLVKYAYTTESDYGKLTIRYSMKKHFSDLITFTIGKALTFRENGQNLPVSSLIDQLVRDKAQEYRKCAVSGSSFVRAWLMAGSDPSC